MHAKTLNYIQRLERKYKVPEELIQYFLCMSDEFTTEQACYLIWKGARPDKIKQLIKEGKNLSHTIL